jgi:spore coat protein U-like protein
MRTRTYARDMSSTSTATRIAAPLLAGALLLPLSACSFSAHGVTCSTSSCTVTLSGEDAEVDVLGTTLSFGGVQDGRASLSVGGASVSCGEGETVTAGPLELQCSSVTGDSVELTASLG